jgi:4-aminobutyrate--pyruvate transaminase
MAVLIRSANTALLGNLATRDIETLLHPQTNLAALRETGRLVIERGQGARRRSMLSANM